MSELEELKYKCGKAIVDYINDDKPDHANGLELQVFDGDATDYLKQVGLYEQLYWVKEKMKQEKEDYNAKEFAEVMTLLDSLTYDQLEAVKVMAGIKMQQIQTKD